MMHPCTKIGRHEWSFSETDQIHSCIHCGRNSHEIEIEKLKSAGAFNALPASLRNKAPEQWTERDFCKAWRSMRQ